MSAAVYTPEFVERGYNNRAAVPEHPRWLALYPELSAKTRAELSPQLDLRYGPGPKETLDLFVPATRARGTFLFLHGGYWRALDKSDFSFVAAPFVAAGFAAAIANYDLCPQVRIGEIVDECRCALEWLVRDGPAQGADAANVVVGGHSAGGHLTAMLYTTDWGARGFARDPIKAGLSLSGLHDLEPLVQFSHNVDFRLDHAEALRLSPMRLRPRTRAPLLLAAGADETSEFVRQTRVQWEAWPDNRPQGAQGPMLVAGRDHFTVVLDYADDASELTQASLALFSK